MESLLSRSSPEPQLEEQLTPRSKVAKLLADIDNASSPSSAHVVVSSAARTNDPVNTDISFSRRIGSFSPEKSDEPTDSDDQIRRPLSKAARRMLSKRSSISPRQVATRSPTAAAGSREDSSSEDAMPNVRRRRQRQSPSPTVVRALSQSPKAEGLFVSPAKSTSLSDEELPSNPFGSENRFAQLVAQKRAERKAREQEAEQQRQQSSRHQQNSSDLPNDMIEQQTDQAINPDVERLLSDAVRPSRKASKKAMQDMARETQRMAREQALAHGMKVRRKFTTTDLLTRFNFHKEPAADKNAHVDEVSSSAPNSDATLDEHMQSGETPPSSPPMIEEMDKTQHLGFKIPSAPKTALRQNDCRIVDDDEELPELASLRKLASSKPTPLEAVTEYQPQLSQMPPPITISRLSYTEAELDDDLEIIQPLPKHLAVFERAKSSRKAGPDNSCKAIHTLRHLSHIGAYDAVVPKKGVRPSLGQNTLEARLRRRAKQQAREEELERIAELKAKGISFQTAEDREKEAEVFENLLEKAREEALKLRQTEKAARAEDPANEGTFEVSDDETEDEEYMASGSEDGDDEGDEEEDGANENGSVKGVLDTAAVEADSTEGSETGEDEDEDEDAHSHDLLNDFMDEASSRATLTNKEQVEHSVDVHEIIQRRPRRLRVIEDEEDEEYQMHAAVSTPVVKPSQTQTPRTASQDDPFAIFNAGAGLNNAMLMSPTQAFNATMQTPSQASQAWFPDFGIQTQLGNTRMNGTMLPSGQGQTQSQFDREISVVPGSQVYESQKIELTWDTQPPETPQQQNTRQTPILAETPGWEPTQDEGLQSPWPIGLARQDTMESLLEHETQSTVRLRISESPAPSTPLRRGRLVRGKKEDHVVERFEQVTAASNYREPAPATNVFERMEHLRKADISATEKAAALEEMKGMMDDQAEESDDEYAGLGGDDYFAPENEQDKEMIDSSHVDVDERALAAHFAERQRLQDEAETSKLYKDLTTGALRRKQANMFDLEDDEDEMAIRRRQLKQQAEAKKRKLLLQDDNIAGLAGGNQSIKKDAFLKAIADDDEEDDLSELSDSGEPEPAESKEQDDDNETRAQETVLQEISGNKRGPSNDFDKAEDRPPAKMRRTKASGAFKKPASMLEVKESVSFLLEDPNTMWSASSTIAMEIETTDGRAEDDEEEEQSDEDGVAALITESRRDNDGGFVEMEKSVSVGMLPPRLSAPQRRTVAAKAEIVDRLSLKRAGSSSSENSRRSAWAYPVSSGIKVSSLLRRATTNMGMDVNERGVSTPNLSRESSGVKMGGSKKSSLAYQARAEERMAIVEASARRRQENTAKIAQLRRHSTADALLGKGLGGRFE